MMSAICVGELDISPGTAEMADFLESSTTVGRWAIESQIAEPMAVRGTRAKIIQVRAIT